MQQEGEAGGDDRTEVARPSPSRRWRPGRRWLTIGLLVTMALILAVLLAPTPVLDALARRSVAGYGGECAELDGIEVRSGPWPVVARAVLGHVDAVSAEIDEIRLADPQLAYHDISFSAARIDVGPLGGLVGHDDIEIEDGTATVTVRFDDLEALLADHGFTVALTSRAGSVAAAISVPPFGELPTTVHVVAVEGRLELQFVPLDLVALPPLPVDLPAPVAVRTVEVRPDGVRIDATIDGTLRPAGFTCDV
jgi:hypothetical protein